MSAVVEINRLTGSGGFPFAITDINTRVVAADAPYVDELTYPVKIPDVGTNYSFWCTTQLDCITLPDVLINNIRWYTDTNNNFGTGITCFGNTTDTDEPVYTQATGTIGETGDPLTTVSYPGLVLPDDIFAFTEDNPLAVPGESTVLTGPFAGFVIYQFAIDPTANPGPSQRETITWLFDEV